MSDDNVKNACERFEEDLVTLADGELSGEAKEKLEAHLADCEACRAVFADLKGLGDELQAGWPAEEPSEAWEARSESFIRRQAEVEQKKITQGSKDKAGRGWWGFLLRPAFAVSFGLALLVVGFVTLKGDNLRSMYAAHSQALSGNEGPTAGHEYQEEALATHGQAARGVDTNRSKDSYSHRRVVNFKSPKRDKDSRRPGQWDRSRGLDTSSGLVPSGGVDLLRGGKGFGGRTGIGPGGLAGGRAGPPPSMNANAYFKSTYRAGGGDRERLEQLVAAGVLVDGKQLKLGSLTRGYAQHFTVPGRSALGINAGLDRGKVLASAGGEVFMQVGIQAAKREMNKRPPLNMALVIDRSGSMSSGGKMGAARKAARRFVDGLREDDQVTLIAYDTRVESISARGDQKERLRGFIKGLKPRGSTNIHGALDRAYRAVAKTSRPGRINTVLLLSDGLPTSGNTSPAAIVAQARVAAEAGISTSTVGMGLDYNDELMMGVSEKGQGHYHFVKDAGSVEGIFKAEIASLNRVVARALKLRIVLAEGVVLRRVLGSPQLSDNETRKVRANEKRMDHKFYEELGIKSNRQKEDEPGIKMMIPYFFSGDSHVVMLQLWVPPGTERRKLASITLKYKDMLNSKNGMDERDVAVIYADAKEEVVASISKPIKKNLLGFRAGEALLGASKLLATGQVGRAANMLDQQREMFEAAGQAWGDAQLTKDATLLGQYRDVVLSLDQVQMATGRRDNLRSYLAKTMSHGGWKLVR